MRYLFLILFIFFSLCATAQKPLHFLKGSDSLKTYFPNVQEYLFNADSTVLVVNTGDSIKWITSSVKTIWTGKSAFNLTFDFSGRQLAFMTDSAVWYYKKGDLKPVRIAIK